MAIPSGLTRVQLGSTKPERRGPKPPKSRTKEVHSRVIGTFDHIASVKTISPTSRSTNGSGFPVFTFTGYTFNDESGTPHAGSTFIGSDIEFTINTVRYDSTQYTITVNPTNIIIDFTEDIFTGMGETDSNDVVRLRARVKTVS